MIHAYCRHSDDGCQNEQVVRQAVSYIENRIGAGCRSKTETDRQAVLLALKALGNAGIVVSSGETLRKCYQVSSVTSEHFKKQC